MADTQKSPMTIRAIAVRRVPPVLFSGSHFSIVHFPLGKPASVSSIPAL
jgi:hypothetical protein